MLPMKLEHFMKEPVVVDVEDNETVHDVAKAMKKRHRGSALILKKDMLVGIITERDILFKVIAEGLDPKVTRAETVMTKNPTTLSIENSAMDALKCMQERSFRNIPIMSGETVVGIISLMELYAAFKESLEKDLAQQIAYVRGDDYSK